MDLSTSVIIATYNGEKFIIEQLNSIKNQTIAVDEVIIADDGSQDQTVDIVRNYIEVNDLSTKWRLIVNHENKGYEKNFFSLLGTASKDLIFFCDQDDIWFEDKVEKLKQQFLIHPTINLISTNFEDFYTGDSPLRWSQKDLDEVSKDSGEMEVVEFSTQNFQCQRSGCVMTIRKSFFEQIQPYWTEGWGQDDFVWKMSVLTDSNAIYHYKGIKRRFHSGNTTNIKVRTRDNRISKVRQLGKSYNSCESFIEDNKASIQNFDQKLDTVIKNQNNIKYRLSTLENHNIFTWILSILKYRECYPSRNTMILDFYFIFKKVYKQ